MRNLRFNRLLLLSDSQRSANAFKFAPGYNLITGKNNSIGKSTLVKSLLWTLGCEPTFDDTWKALDCKALIEFSIGADNYSVYRYHNTIKAKKNNQEYKKYLKISGEFAEFFADAVSFHAMLPNRPAADEMPELETPPPAYYFLPFYIDQIRGWGKLWDPFDNLGQYEGWKQPIIKYHTGYLSPRHFEIEQELYEYKRIKEQFEAEIKRIDTALMVVEQYTPKSTLSVDEKELAEITDEVKGTLSKLAAEQEAIFDKIAIRTSDVHYLRNQLRLLHVAIADTEKDYIFSVENVSSDNIACPVCGTLHDNSIVDRAGILADKTQLEKQAGEIEIELANAEKILGEQGEHLNKLQADIEFINEKYAITDANGDKHQFSHIVDGLASRAVQRNVGKTKDSKQLDARKAQEKQNELKKAQNKLLPKKQKQERDNHFITTLTYYVGLLGAQGINLNGVKSPLNYKKLIANGGAAESTRAILAYQMAVLDMASRYGSSVLSPFIIDTPNQHEQAKVNYQSIIELILDEVTPDQQVFLCALESPMLKPYKDKSQVVELDMHSKLLKADLYDQIGSELRKVIEA